MGMGEFIQRTDLDAFATIDPAKADAMIEDAEADAILIAPCIPGLLTPPADETPEQRVLREAKLAGIKSTLRAAILRWAEAGSGTSQSVTAGPFGQVQQIQGRRSMFWPTETEKLQGICRTEDAKAFSIDTVPSAAGHRPWCSLMFGATYCSCGTDIAGHPIYEGA